MSSRPAAPRIASISACETTSPSECPASPRPASSTPPRTSFASYVKACASIPIPTRSSLIGEQSLHEGEVGRSRDLDEARVALDDAYPAAGRLHESRTVARISPAQQRVPQRGDGKRLRRLNRIEPRSVDGLGNAPMLVDSLHGVGERHPGDDAGPVLAEAAENATDDLLREKRPRRVVDERDQSVVWDLRNPRPHRVGPRGAAGHRRVHLAGVELLGEQDGRFLPFLRNDDHDRVDPLGGLEALEALGEKHALPEPDERLRPVPAEPLSPACCDQDGPGAHCERATSCPLRSSKSSGLSGFFPVVNSCRTLSLITGA